MKANVQEEEDTDRNVKGLSQEKIPTVPERQGSRDEIIEYGNHPQPILALMNHPYVAIRLRDRNPDIFFTIRVDANNVCWVRGFGVLGK